MYTDIYICYFHLTNVFTSLAACIQLFVFNPPILRSQRAVNPDISYQPTVFAQFIWQLPNDNDNFTNRDAMPVTLLMTDTYFTLDMFG